MRKRLGVAVAAMMLGSQLGSPTAMAMPPTEKLEAISFYIESGDIESLILYIEANPDLLEGDSLIAIRLREFMAAAEDLSTYLAFDPPMRSAIAEQLLAMNTRDGPSGPIEESFALY